MPFFASPIKIVKPKWNNKLLNERLSMKHSVFKNKSTITKENNKDKIKEMN